MLLVAVGLFYTNAANRNTNEANLEQQKLALQGQTADRFSAAIDHLGQEDEKGHDKLSIRLGGIYALQQLMVDSGRDRPAIVQVLCAFVRTHAPRPARTPRTVPPAPVDVRAAVAVLALRPDPDATMVDFSDTLLGLKNIDLTGLTWPPESHLEYADLRGADLTRAYLLNAGLEGAHLNGAHLNDAYLDGAMLGRAELRGADLRGANLLGTDLTCVLDECADLRGADLRGANLTGADLTGADLIGADLRGANLTGARGLTPQQLAQARTDSSTRGL